MFEEWSESAAFAEDGGLNLYASQGGGNQGGGDGSFSRQTSIMYDFDANAELAGVERPMFSLLQLQQDVAQGRGVVTCAAAAEDMVLVCCCGRVVVLELLYSQLLVV